MITIIVTDGSGIISIAYVQLSQQQRRYLTSTFYHSSIPVMMGQAIHAAPPGGYPSCTNDWLRQRGRTTRTYDLRDTEHGVRPAKPYAELPSS